MSLNDLVKITSFASIVLSILLILFLLFVKTKNRNSNFLFSFFIFFNALEISSWFTDKYLQYIPSFLMLRVMSSLLINPFFYLYILSLCYSDFRLRAKNLWHILPFVLFNLLVLPDFYLKDAPAQMQFFENFSDHWQISFFAVFCHVQFLFYIVLVFRTLFRFRKIYRDNFAETGMQTYQWAIQLTVLITLVHAIIVIKDVLPFTSLAAVHDAALLLVAVNALFIISWFVLKTMFHPELFRKVDSHIPPADELTETKEIITGSELQENITRLREHMEKAEPFLEARLTIQQLADQLQVPVKDLSILINHHIGLHFFDFINEYRIKKARQLLREHTASEMTIQQVFYTAGFNSKSTFHAAWKKFCTETPGDYRKQNLTRPSGI